jgi:hypothetical protein
MSPVRGSSFDKLRTSGVQKRHAQDTRILVRMRAAALTAVVVGAGGSVALMLRAGQRSPTLLIVLFLGWVLSPFVLFVQTSSRVRLRGRSSSVLAVARDRRSHRRGHVAQVVTPRPRRTRYAPRFERIVALICRSYPLGVVVW